jgi:hypothetical protein
MSSENDRYAHADRVPRGDTAAREGQPNQDRPEEDRRDEDRRDEDRRDEDGVRADGRDRLHRVGDDRADRGARWNRGDQPYVDAQALTDLDAQVYEAVATLEYAGHSVTRDEVMRATDLDNAAAGEILDTLTEQGVLIRTPADDGGTYELARRDWSATPETPSR